MNLDRDAVTAEGRRSVKISSGLDQMAGPPRLGVRISTIQALQRFGESRKSS